MMMCAPQKRWCAHLRSNDVVSSFLMRCCDELRTMTDNVVWHCAYVMPSETFCQMIFYFLSHCLSVSLSLCLSVSLFLCLSVSLSLCLSVSLSLCLSVSLSLCLSISLSLCLFWRLAHNTWLIRHQTSCARNCWSHITTHINTHITTHVNTHITTHINTHITTHMFELHTLHNVTHMPQIAVWH